MPSQPDQETRQAEGDEGQEGVERQENPAVPRDKIKKLRVSFLAGLATRDEVLCVDHPTNAYSRPQAAVEELHSARRGGWRPVLELLPPIAEKPQKELSATADHERVTQICAKPPTERLVTAPIPMVKVDRPAVHVKGE